MGNDFDEDRIGAITHEFYGRELDADRIRTVADEFQDQEVLMCDFAEFVLVVSFNGNCLLTFLQSVIVQFVIKSVQVDFILSHVGSTTKFYCVSRSATT